MSDGKVSGDTKSLNLWKPVRKSRILKGSLALVLGIALISMLVPATAQAKGTSIAIERVHNQFVVVGHGFTANTRGTVWAQLDNATAQKEVWTSRDGSFTETFYALSNGRFGQAQAKAWVQNGYAHTSTTYSHDTTGSGSASSVALDSAKDGAPTISPANNNPTTTTSSTVAPSPVVADKTPMAPVSTNTTSSPSAIPANTTSTTTKPTLTPTPPTTGTTASTTNPGNDTGFTDVPSGNWKLAFSDDFTGNSLDTSKWGTYDGAGNEGIGTRSSKQDAVSNGEMTITGNGTVAGGMASNWSGTYGLYEVRARMDANSRGYNDAILLWPTAENWPVGGEIDMQEIFDGKVSTMSCYAHWGSNNSQTGKDISGDFSQWHTVAVDWEPTSVTYYLDGQVVMTVTGDAVPSTPHFIGIQLDVASDNNKDSGAQLHVDWVKAYTHS